MIGRDRDLAIAISLIQDGGSLDVVGSRESGRSTFLEALSARLEHAGWTAIRLRGVASLRQHPLAAMQLAGVVRSNDVRPLTLQSTSEALEGQVRPNRSVIVVDDWDDLDEASWGIVEGIRRSLSVPVLISRLQGRRARHTPSGLEASTLEPAFVVEMSPLRFDDLELAVERLLGDPVERATMRRVYAKSGGIVGLALNLVSAAVREGRMRKVGVTWSTNRDLWSPGLRGVVEAHLENLSDEARDALEMIALIGDADIETVGKLVDGQTLELLEQRAMIQTVASGTRHLVTVVPPLLVEFFRHEPLMTRRIRLRQKITDSLGVDPSDVLPLSTPAFAPEPEQEAALVRLIQERVRTRQLVTRAEWDAHADVKTTVEYASALMVAGASEDTIDGVLWRADVDPTDSLGAARLTVLRARWLASGGDVDAALEHLRATAAGCGDLGGLLVAAGITLRCQYLDVPEDFVESLEVGEDMPDVVRAAHWDAQLVVLVTLARFGDALRVYRTYEDDTRAAALMPPWSRALYGLALLGDGALDEALTWCQRGLDESFGYLDLEAARVFGLVVTFAHLQAGDYEPVDDLVGTLLAAGPFPRVAQGERRGLLTVAALVAIRKGNIAVGERYVRELQTSPGVDGLLPGQSVAWAAAQLAAFNGDTREAAGMLWEAGVALRRRGGNFASAIALLNACEIQPTSEWLDDVSGMINGLGERMLTTHLAYVCAAAEEDAAALVAVHRDLALGGRTGLALASLRKAAQRYRAVGDEHKAVEVEERAAEFSRSLPHPNFDSYRFATAVVSLTGRELEIARLVAEGMSNPEIATQLVLSVRTVESHMHRIMRKLDLPNRQAVGEFILTRYTL